MTYILLFDRTLTRHKAGSIPAPPTMAKRTGKIRIRKSVRLMKNNAPIIGVDSTIKPIKNNSAIIRVRVKPKNKS